MYHNQSEDVFIENANPNLIFTRVLEQPGMTSLKHCRFHLQNSCFVPVTKQEFCNSELKQIKFILNGKISPDALDLKIEKNEVDEVRWLDLETFEKWTKSEEKMLADHEEEYSKLISYLRNI